MCHISSTRANLQMKHPLFLSTKLSSSSAATGLLGKSSADFKWPPQSDSYNTIYKASLVFVQDGRCLLHQSEISPNILIVLLLTNAPSVRIKGPLLCCVPVDHCMAPMKVGPCRGSFPRWHYNAASQKCEMFIYGGCRDNLNNYLSEDECNNACSGSGISSVIVRGFRFLCHFSCFLVACLHVHLNMF